MIKKHMLSSSSLMKQMKCSATLKNVRSMTNMAKTGSTRINLNKQSANSHMPVRKDLAVTRIILQNSVMNIFQIFLNHYSASAHLAVEAEARQNFVARITMLS